MNNTIKNFGRDDFSGLDWIKHPLDPNPRKVDQEVNPLGLSNRGATIGLAVALPLVAAFSVSIFHIGLMAFSASAELSEKAFGSEPDEGPKKALQVRDLVTLAVSSGAALAAVWGTSKAFGGTIEFVFDKIAEHHA